MTIDGGITAMGLGKDYDRRAVLDGVDLEVAPGRVLGLIGPNGAGKTTVVRILSTLIRPDRGRAMVAGHDVVTEPERVRRRISLTGQFTAVDALQTGRETLTMIGRLLDLPRPSARRRSAELLERFDLSDAADRRVGTYSGGMRRRLDIAASLVVEPAVLFLDEPTTGLDPRSRIALWEVVLTLKASGTTILLTTQYLEEADRLADEVVLLDTGRVVARGTPSQLKSAVGGSRLEVVLASDAAFARSLDRFSGRVVYADAEVRTVAVSTDGGVDDIRDLLGHLTGSDIDVQSLSVSSASLDDVFIALTGPSAQPAQLQENSNRV